MANKYILTAVPACVMAVCIPSAAAYAAAPGETGESATGVASSPLGSEIIVTARRKSEALQDVPQALNVVTADAIARLNVTQFADIQSVVSGLTLSQEGNGYQTSASIRGVSFDANTKAPPTVAMYLDDVSVQSLFLFSSFYDVGQVEVLRGPQGTVRGVSAPSGAITVTTRKPDLKEFGGYVNGTLSDHDGGNLQAALNIPLVKDVFAIRLAGMYERNDVNGVRSIHNSIAPSQDTLAGRITALYKPSADFSLTLSYSHLDKRFHGYDQVSGPGQGTLTNPAIAPEDRLSVQDGLSNVRTRQDFVTAQVDAQLLGQRLSYTGSYQDSYIYSGLVADQGNLLPGIELPYVIPSGKRETTQEIRLSSNPAPGRLFDYVVGFYYDWASAYGHVDSPGPLMPGAFGSPAGPADLSAYNPAYQTPLTINFPYRVQETSLFGSLTLHLGSQTELTGGVRHIWSKFRDQTDISTKDGQIALPLAYVNPLLPNCATAGLGSTYAGFCDVPIPGGLQMSRSFRSSEQPTIYNISLSHHVNKDLMVYANTGTSYRPPVSDVGIQGNLATTTNPLLTPLTTHPSERSTSYEIGFKSTFLGNRGNLNVALYHQKFRNMTLYVPNILYIDTSTGYPSLYNFTTSVNATVKGIDVDLGYKFSRNFSMSAQFNYADGKVDGSLVPCNTYSGSMPTFNTDGLISMCPGGSVSRSPKWNATVQAEYNRPIASHIDGFVRTLVNYNPQNRNRAEPNFTVGSYTLVNLYAGVRSQDGAWELSVFARNAFKATKALDISPAAYNANTSLGMNFPALIPVSGSGYYATTMTPRREFGINLRYAWGSR